MASEYGAVEIHPDGTATMKAGTSAHGQGHQTTFAMLVSDQTGIPVDKIRLVQSDTDLVRTGGGTGGSRSLQLGGSAVHNATLSMVDKAKHLAAHLLEASVEDIVVNTDSATVGVVGVPSRALSWGELAQAALRRGDLGDGGLAAHLGIGVLRQLADQGDDIQPFRACDAQAGDPDVRSELDAEGPPAAPASAGLPPAAKLYFAVVALAAAGASHANHTEPAQREPRARDGAGSGRAHGGGSQNIRLGQGTGVYNFAGILMGRALKYRN